MFVYVAIALSGMGALGAEVVWTRLLSLLLGGTVYTFSIILAVFLFGLWGGSSAGSFFARKTGDARMALAGCQILLVSRHRLDRRIRWRILCPIGPSTRGFHSTLVQLRSRSRPLRLGCSARGVPVGRQLSSRAGGRGREGVDPGQAVRRSLRREHSRFDPGRALYSASS